MLFCSFEPNYTETFSLRRLLHLQTVYANKNFWAYTFGLLSLKGLIRSQIILYTLFNLPESNQFKFIFNMNHGSNVWPYLWFNRTVQTLFTKLISVHLQFTVFWQQNHNILSEFCWMYELIYCGLLDDLVWTICNLSISQGSFDYSFVHKVYSEYRVWWFLTIYISTRSIFGHKTQLSCFHILKFQNSCCQYYSPISSILHYYKRTKHQKTFSFSEIFGGYRTKILRKNGLNKLSTIFYSSSLCILFLTKVCLNILPLDGTYHSLINYIDSCLLLFQDVD